MLPLASNAPAPQPEGRLHVGSDDETGRRLASPSAHPPSLARSALRRQTPKVGAGCSNWACPDLCGGCPVMRIPTAILHSRLPFASINSNTGAMPLLWLFPSAGILIYEAAEIVAGLKARFWVFGEWCRNVTDHAGAQSQSYEQTRMDGALPARTPPRTVRNWPSRSLVIASRVRAHNRCLGIPSLILLRRLAFRNHELITVTMVCYEPEP
jgi:hypothetical protein